MQLWKKNYLITTILITVILNLGMCAILSLSYKSDYELWVRNVIQEAKSITYVYKDLFESIEDNRTYVIKNSCDRYAENQIITKVNWVSDYGVETTVASSSMIELSNKLPNAIWEEKIGGKYYLAVKKQVDAKDGVLQVFYLKDVTVLYQNYNYTIFAGVGIVLFACMIICVLLYKTMQHIYKPVNNIAHELRSPLTGIQGYAQYIKYSRLKAEDIYFAGDQIERDAKRLCEIIEKLLIMGNVKEGAVEKEDVNIRQILLDIKQECEEIEIENQMPVVKGDKILLKCMFRNLIQNGIRAGGSVRIFSENRSVFIVNEGAIKSPQVLEALNKNQKLPQSEIKGAGYGVTLCHEIAKVHRAKILFSNKEQKETVVSIIFHSSIYGS